MTLPFSLTNSLGGEKVTFVPMKPGHIGIYVCGITVYDYCHIGHARVLIAFDIIVKFLKSEGWRVHYVRNITDVDDKIIQRAKENNEPFIDLANRFIAAMHEDEAALGIARPDQEPRATEHMQSIIAMIEELSEKGYTYKTPTGDVYYKVSAFEDYGKLSNNTVDDLQSGASHRDAKGQGKQDPRDFALWKASQDNAWESPWGMGRPGWHIECSAMSRDCLGQQFDMHGGGPDLRFPHHENEIAQSEAANGCTLANYWLHAGAVRVNGEKMSKSLNNFFTIRDVLADYHPEVIRFLMISSHYRSAISYSKDSLDEAKASLSRLYGALKGVTPSAEPILSDEPLLNEFLVAMRDDFNTRAAVAVMFTIVNRIHQAKLGDVKKTRYLCAILLNLGQRLGVLLDSPERFLQQGASLDTDYIEQQIQARIDAKNNKDYAGADAIRQALKAQGVVLEDSRSGTTWRVDNGTSD